MADRMGRAIARARAYLELHPDAGQVEDPAVRATRIAGLRFTATDAEGHELVSDMPREVGGGESAMRPGSILRAALASCDATVIAMEAAARGIELSRLEVLVQSSSDHRGLLGFDGVEAAPKELRVTYRLASPTASADDLRSLVEYAELHSPVARAVRRAMPVNVGIELA